MAGLTKHSLNCDFDKNGLETNRYRSESSHDFTSAHNFFGFAYRTSMRKQIMSDPKNDAAVLEAGMNVFVAMNSECMIKQTC